MRPPWVRAPSASEMWPSTRIDAPIAAYTRPPLRFPPSARFAFDVQSRKVRLLELAASDVAHGASSERSERQPCTKNAPPMSARLRAKGASRHQYTRTARNGPDTALAQAIKANLLRKIDTAPRKPRINIAIATIKTARRDVACRIACAIGARRGA